MEPKLPSSGVPKVQQRPPLPKPRLPAGKSPTTRPRPAGTPKPPVPVAGPPQVRTSRPYGHAPLAPPMEKRRYLMFGIPYGVAFIPGHLLLAIGGFAVLVMSRVDPELLSGLPPGAVGIMGAIAVYSIVALPISIVVLVLCIRGSTAGLVTGVIHTSFLLLLNIFNIVLILSRPHVHPNDIQVAALIVCAVVLVLGVIQLSRRNRGNLFDVPHDLYQGPIVHMQPGAVYTPAAAPEVQPPARPALTGAQQSFIELLGIAASIDQSRAEARLKRARMAANKVLGPDHKTAVMSLLNDPTLIGDLHDDLEVVARQVREDEDLRAIAPKAAAAVLKENDELDAQATDLLQHLKLELA
jgi:hypothetical protein